jgi:polysaccharide biosynthesis/export protein
MTVYEVRDVITQRLTEFITQPQVDVKVIDFRSQRAYVTGRVSRPGAIPITNVPLTVLDAISQAGGLSDSANWHEVQLTRGGEETMLSVYEMLNNGELTHNLLLHNGDVLNVPEVGNQKVFIMGEIGNRSVPMGNLRLSLTDAIAQSGGLSPANAQASGIFVIRQAPEDSGKIATIYQLDASNALAYVIGARFMLQASDIVYVTTAPLARWNRVITQLTPTILLMRRADQINLLQSN